MLYPIELQTHQIISLHIILRYAHFKVNSKHASYLS